LKAGLEAITVANGYQTTVAYVSNEPAILSDIPDKPGLAAWFPEPEVERFAQGREGETLTGYVWGYVDIQQGDFTNVLKLLSDVRKKLETWTYAGFTEITGTSRWFGGNAGQTGIFEVRFTVFYHSTFGSGGVTA